MSRISGLNGVRAERGAVFVQVGIAIFVLMAFNVFVIDYGMMWVSRHQAQNAADAGALAGAVARGYDDFDSPPLSAGVAATIAAQTARANLVWQQQGTPTVSFGCPPGVTGKCVQVNLYRNGTAGSTPLPTLFGPLLGVTSQGVQATASAIANNGNTVACLKPIAFPDAWTETPGAPGLSTDFNGYVETGPTAGAPLVPRDTYAAPSSSSPGLTTIPDDLGQRIIYELDRRTITTPFDPITAGLVVGLSLTGTGNFQQKIEGCSDQTVHLRDTLTVITPPSGDTSGGFNTLMSQDPGILWNESRRRIENSCAPGCAPISPRLIAVALFDPDRFQLGRATNDWTQPNVGCPTASPCITVTNIVGFFVHGSYGGYGPHGHFLKFPGTSVTTAPTFVDDGSWLVTTHLVR